MKINRLIPPPLGVPIGYLPSGKPVYPVFGGSEDLDIDPDDEGGDEDPDDEGEDEPEDDAPEGGKKGKYAPPDQAEWLKVQSSLSKANASSKQRRLDLAEANKKIAALEAAAAKREADDERRRLVEERLAAAEGSEPKGKRGRGKAGGGAPAALVDLPDGVLTKTQVAQQVKAAEKAAADAAAERFRGMVVGSAARAALVSEGIPKEAVNRLTKLLDLDEIEVDDEGQVTGGLDEQLAALKEELPQLFKPAEPEPPKRQRRTPAPRITPAPQVEADTRQLSSAERMAAMVLGTR